MSYPTSDLLPPGVFRHASDLTLMDSCEIVLAEYSEQYPPLLMQPGMATKIRTYYKKKFSKVFPIFDFGCLKILF